MNTKRIKTPLQIRFNDLDMAGHVHNSEYLNYFEIGRIEFFAKVIDSNWNWKERGILVARNELDYLKPTYFEDSVFIETMCENVGKKSITLTYNLFSEKNGVKELNAKGRSILVCYDFEQNTSVEVFDEWKKALED